MRIVGHIQICREALFGGGGSAAADAEKSRQQARVSNDRVLSAEAGQAANGSAARRAPKGRKLFTTEASQKSTVG